MFAQQAIDEVAVLLRDALAEFLGGQILFGLGGHVFGDQDIDAIGLAIDMRVDPVEFDRQLFGVEGRCAENAEAARLADRPRPHRGNG